MSESLVDAARAFAPRVRDAAPELDRTQRIPADLLDEMTDAGLFRLYVQREMGGEETDPLTVFEVVETIARADGSMGWLIMIAAEISLFTGWLSTDLGREVMDGDGSRGARGRLAGSARPEGVARRVEGGYRATGRWDFASGVLHATWTLGTCRIVGEDGSPLRRPDGRDDLRTMLAPIDQVRVEETWDTMGLRGTGSHDFIYEDVFIPEERALTILEPAPATGPQWTPTFAFVANWVANAGHALGMARGAIEEFRELATTTGSSLSPVLLRDREPARLALARAEASVGAARAFVVEAVGEAWEAVCRGDADPDRIARARLADVHAVHESARAIDLLFRAAGTNAIHTRLPLERYFRDIHVALQHGAGLDANYDLAAQQMLGLDPRLRR